MYLVKTWYMYLSVLFSPSDVFFSFFSRFQNAEPVLLPCDALDYGDLVIKSVRTNNDNNSTMRFIP